MAKVELKQPVVNEIKELPPYKAGCLTLALGGAYLGSCFIQEEPFYTSQNVVVLIPKENITFEAKQFIATAIFKESQNMTVMDYVTKVKLDEAKKMLSNPRYKIEEIAMSLGYSDGSYFSKVFRRHEGMTPTQFRQNL